MNPKKLFIVVSAGVLAVSASAEEQERVVFGKWRIGIGGAFNSQVGADVGVRHLPSPAAYVVPAGSTKQDALDRANARTYDGGGYIKADAFDNGFDTTNWKLPTSTYQGNGKFQPENAYKEVIGSSVDVNHKDRSDDCCQFGISLDASRELWIHDEAEEHRWGLDFTAAFSYFFARDIFTARGNVTRSDNVRDGVLRTDIEDPSVMYDYDQGWDSPSGGMYGYGVYNRQCVEPALNYSGIGAIHDFGGPSSPVTSSYGYRAKGDYQELEMLFMLRPWYEITDWWRVFAQVGVGVSWGRFDTEFRGAGLSYDEAFNQWDCYGVAGLGTMLRYDSYTLSVDVLGRFLRDDLDVDGRYVNGSIDRADWGLRVMVGYDF